jgi:hypothetical protein
MPKETNTAGDFAERSVEQMARIFNFDIGMRGTGQSPCQLWFWLGV